MPRSGRSPGRRCGRRPASLHEHERQHGSDVEPLGEVGLFVDVDAYHAKTRALFARDVREQALHPACGANASDEKKTSKASHVAH
jgi:hypothetical protein